MSGWIWALAAAATAAGASTAAGPALTLTGSAFYAERAMPDGTVYRTETRQIAYEPGTSCYRWEVRFRPGVGTRVLRERLVLPGTADVWGGVDGNPDTPTRLSARRDVGVTDLVAVLPTGHAGNGWCVAEGDPRGKYRIEVRDGQRLLARFDFDVVDAR